MSASRWSDPEVQRGRNEAESLEVAMRSILRMFVDGNLVYRRREITERGISKSSDRLRRIRRQCQSHATAPAAAV